MDYLLLATLSSFMENPELLPIQNPELPPLGETIDSTSTFLKQPGTAKSCELV